MDPMLSPLSVNPFTLLSDSFTRVPFGKKFYYRCEDRRELFWDQECEIHPNMSHCKLFDD